MICCPLVVGLLGITNADDAMMHDWRERNVNSFMVCVCCCGRFGHAVGK